MIPSKLIIENFISHVKSELDFSKFDAALLVGAHSGNPYISNGVGKSSIFDSMRWAISGKSRFSTKDKVVKRGKSFCRVTFEFMIDDEEYRIERRLNKLSNITDVNFYKKVGNKWEADGLTCDTPTMTNRKIMEVIKMSDDTFVNSVYFKQNDVSGFASATTTKRKEILKEILQIGMWDNFQQTAKDTAKRFEDQRVILEERLKIVGDIETQKTENQSRLKDLSTQMVESKGILTNLEKKLSKQKQIVSDLETIVAQQGGFDLFKLKDKKKSISARANEIKQKRGELREQIKTNNKEIEGFNDDREILKQKLVQLSEKVLKVSRIGGKKAKEIFANFGSGKSPKSQYSQAALKRKKADLERHKKALNASLQDFENLDAVKPGRECPVCLSEIKNPRDIAQRRRTRKKELKSRISREKAIVEELSVAVKKEQNAIDRAKEAMMELEKTEFMLAKKASIYDDITHRNEIIQIELKNLDISWKNLKEEYSKIKNILDVVKKGEDIHVELESAKSEYNKISNILEKSRKSFLDLSVQFGIIKGRIEELERKESEKRVVENQLVRVLKEIEVYKKLSKAFGKDGIQAIIMENITEDLKKYANSILKQICSDPMTIDFITQKQTGSGSWKEQFDIKIFVESSELDFDDLSGGEQVRVSIALRLALSQLLMRRMGSNVKFLLLDEVDQALDRHGIDALSSAVLALSKNLKILVITHNEGMKEKFENIITIQKGADGSVLKQ